MEPNNQLAAPDSFENCRLEALMKLHRAIGALGQVPNYATLVDQRSWLHDQVHSLLPTLISPEEAYALDLLIGSVADTRTATLGL